ncbi:MAG: tRNA (adenosine(37)-N6)-threonylcarbamoyltransferase complex ATPase subunit type 1 TsaE [Chloroflexota bacterium]|nr:tRNA (adenosine(37)-N6)-threonylcarbamoyltransferase complex ATPase subunit type 1 TsaE [Chloroflexota bacterium]MDE2969543.1 tRNA (adenosine(37)-N6)-threonylcarbamoyltransferase complex ATPase subunit type 1 TsaE [Chloroflexota bacterium]
MSIRVNIESRSADETLRIGEELGRRLQPGDALLLTGDLGAGKTTLTQGVGLGLDIPERPRSPTFVMATEYHGRLPMYHLDLYRVEDLGELGELGLDEYLIGDGVTVVEWADRAPHAFPARGLWVDLQSTGEGAREITVSCDAPGNAAVAEWLEQAAVARSA